MFTGIITEIGTLLKIRTAPGGRDLEISCSWTDLVAGESIAVDGACLTVAGLSERAFTVHVVHTSLDRTRFGDLLPGHRVNLERALRVGERLGGHPVQGRTRTWSIFRRPPTWRRFRCRWARSPWTG